MNLSFENIFTFSALILSFGLLITTLEKISCWKDYRDGFLRWDVAKTATKISFHSFASVILDVVMNHRNFLRLLSLKLIAIFALIAMLVFDCFDYAWIPLLIITVNLFLFNFRNYNGLDGSDQMFLIMSTVLFLWSVDINSKLLATVCNIFIAAQCMLAYATAGIAKIVSPLWRSGNGLAAILDTKSFGTASLSTTLITYPSLSKFVSWSLIIWEATFPLVLVNETLLVVYLVAGILFHFAAAFVMGLNGFLWSFGAAYPSVVWVCWWIDSY